MPILTNLLQRISLCALTLALVLPSDGRAYADLPVLGNPVDDWHNLVDYTKLEELLFGAVPTGAGIAIAQVEAASSSTNFSNFFPDTTNTEFDAAGDLSGTAVTFVNGSQAARPNPTTSAHATTTVGRNIYGNRTGAASESNTIVVFEANDYLNTQLRAPNGSDPLPPEFEDPTTDDLNQYKVINHSWAGDYGSNTNNRRALVRLDYVIDKYDVTMAVGVSINGDTDPATSKGPHPDISPLLGQSYNAIAVGTPQGLHSIQTTDSYYGGGRSKPDIVAGGFNVSSNTAMVSSVASILHEVVAGTDAERSETMKAILLAGATKEEYFQTFVDPETGLVDSWHRTPTQPLDNIFGAGQLNAFNSYVMTEGGQFSGSTGTDGTPIAHHGWDYQPQIDPADVVKYEFTIPEGKHAAELSIVLAWNYEITDINPGNTFTPSESFANLDLELVDANGAMIDHSVSLVDNVEHIYVVDLEPGTYTFQVSTDAARDFGIAWRVNTAFDEVSADFDGDGDVDSADLLTWQRGFGTLVGAQGVDGDADGDGDVDEDDRALLDAQFGLVLGTLDAIAATIPEPTGATLLGGVLFYLVGSRGRRRSFAA